MFLWGALVGENRAFTVPEPELLEIAPLLHLFFKKKVFFLSLSSPKLTTVYMNIYSQFWKPVPFCAWKNLQPNTTVCAREHFHTSDICILHLSVSLMTLQIIGSAQAHKQKVTFYIRTVFITFTFTLLIRQHVTFVWPFVNRYFFLRWMCKRLINPDGKICNLDGL